MVPKDTAKDTTVEDARRRVEEALEARGRAHREWAALDVRAEKLAKQHKAACGQRRTAFYTLGEARFAHEKAVDAYCAALARADND